MNSLSVRHGGGEYPVYVGQGLLDMPGCWMRHVRGRVLVVSDDNVARHYLARIESALADVAHRKTVILPSGEEHKSLANWQKLIEALVDLRAQRDATVVALGGGVIGDMAGFAAASYMRGIQVIQIPTTLLAQVDAAVGGKTGVNLAAGKNLVGAFHAPAAVVIDVDTLNTLDEREYRAGLAEVVKYGAIRDPDFFAWLEQEAEPLVKRLPDALIEAVRRSVGNKAEVVAADERESGERALLNFGHTFGHALETATEYRRYRHGEAVAIGMSLAARLSELLSLAPPGSAERLNALLARMGLETQLAPEQDREQLLDLMRLDKKNQAEQIRLVLLESIGCAMVRPCTPEQIREVFRDL
ncbi:MAG: 3-dehydroquinate synthase [Wenzhouxiangella sp.]